MTIKPFGEMKEIKGEDQFALYFNRYTAAFNLVMNFYRKGGKDTAEAGAVSVYLQKILKTLQAERLKFAFNPAYAGELKVSLQTSGFPSAASVRSLETDLARRDELLKSFPRPVELLKEHALTELLQKGDEPVDILYQIAQVSYLRSLDLREQFFTFTPGKIFLAEGKDAGKQNGDTRRRYHFTWGVYDGDQHCPAIYIMTFLQSADAPPMHEPGPHVVRFLELVQQVAGRADDVLRNVGVRLDESLSDISPHIIRRICFNNLICPAFYGDITVNEEVTAVCKLFKQAGLNDEDFLMRTTVETLYAGREEIQRSLFGRKEVKQVFFVPEERFYPREARRGTSVSMDFVLAPHQFFQQAAAGDSPKLPMLDGAEKVPYTKSNTKDGVKLHVHENIR